MPTALVTGSPDRLPEITIALKSAGYDILAAGVTSPEDAPDIAANSVDCYVQLPSDTPEFGDGALRRTREVVAHELTARFDTAARFLPLLAAGATVMLVTEGADPVDDPAAGTDPDHRTARTLAGVLAEAIVRDGGRAGIRTSVVAEHRAVHEIAALADRRPPEPSPWWRYATVDDDLAFADWRASILCLATPG